ncbi:general odorant-binding protein 83a-like [Trichogramma pretiosum]|uniref:general odorant-binding protein 83a-like n=1 Tax=Trichogramma pretiosum TaxID=7493 RepID=UPI0006C9C9A0|nr:general odorant-binding protein 83a-like [Trichogramma pretiosum]
MKFAVFTCLMVLLVVQHYPLVQCKKMNIEELKGFTKPLTKTCKTKTGISEATLAQIAKREFPPDPVLKCYFRCIAQMGKMMDKKGNLILENMIKQVELLIVDDISPRVKSVFTECFGEMTAEESCQLAFDFIMCIERIDQELNIIV